MLYSSTHRPKQGDSLFPWHVTLYLNGDYLCGATLVHKYWIMTSTVCAQKVDLDAKQDVLVARMGGSRDQFSLSARDQVRTVGWGTETV